MMVGNIFAYLTFDEYYKRDRKTLINKSIKSFSDGATTSYLLLYIACLAMFTQFTYMWGLYSKFACLLRSIIVFFVLLIGFCFKPFFGMFDCLSKFFETLGYSVMDDMSDRVNSNARLPRSYRILGFLICIVWIWSAD